jgi:cytochrome c oxidase subunit 3
VVDQPYSTAPQQREAATMGMFVFLGTEIMLFGGLFAVALGLRLTHPRAFVDASLQLHVWIGAINTAVLLTSSAVVALAVHAARADQPRTTTVLFIAAAVLGVVFLGIKAYEYATEYREGLLLPPVGVQRLFMDLYLVSTGLHALHVMVGAALLATVAAFAPRRAIVVENAGLFWHLVDAIWVFLYPVLYLAR